MKSNTLNIESLLKQIQQELESERTVLEASARATHEAATHEESRAEDAHDTRGLEASYLAAGQAKRLQEISVELATLKVVEQLPQSDQRREISVPCLMQLRRNGSLGWYLLLPCSGGRVLNPSTSEQVAVISTASPLGQELLGQQVGAEIEIASGKGVQEFEIVAIASGS